MASAINAVVLDVEGDVLAHNNGGRWMRLVLQQVEARSLLHQLSQLLGEEIV